MCTHVHTISRPVPIVGSRETLASTGGYRVHMAEFEDVPRLRELEREFVFDHSEVFRNEPWHAQMKPHDWCNLVGVIHEETKAVDCIKSIVSLSRPDHFTLKCVHVSTDE